MGTGQGGGAFRDGFLARGQEGEGIFELGAILKTKLNSQHGFFG